MTHIVVDPVTRIEGHLRIEAEVDGGKVSRRLVLVTMFRGIELILKGRDPRDAWAFTQRICGVCTTVHAIASIRAVEDAHRRQDPAQRAPAPEPDHRRRRCVQDHVIHFYHLHALDWVDVVSALSAPTRPKTSGARPVDLRLAAVELRDLLRRRPGPGEGLRRRAASSARSPTPTGVTRPTSCRPRPT